MAQSPSVLGGYLQLSAMKRARLSRWVSGVVSIAVQTRRDCQLRLDAHVAAARTFGVLIRTTDVPPWNRPGYGNNAIEVRFVDRH